MLNAKQKQLDASVRFLWLVVRSGVMGPPDQEWDARIVNDKYSGRKKGRL